jgi:predicted dehydrogenase
MPYGGGAIGDWVCHVVDPSFWALDLDMPVAITAEVEGYDPKEHGDTFPRGTKLTYEFAAKGKRGPVKLYWYDGKMRIPRPAELDEETKVVGTGAVVRGSEGVIMHGSHGAGGVRIVPEAKMKAYKRPAPSIPRVPRGNHQHDWLNAVREGRPAGSPFESGGRLSEIGLLGTVAIRCPGKRLEYDEKAMRFTNDEEASKLLTHQYRDGWTLG